MNHNSRPSAIQIPTDAFSSGQVGSKLWLCEKLEAICATRGNQTGTIWIYGGWQGVLGFMLLSRAGFADAKVRSFDLDPAGTDNANAICENWVWRAWQFRAFTQDCNELDPAQGMGDYGPPPTVVINTSVEHFERRAWFEKIPKGTIVALQASDFEHDGAVALFSTEAKLAEAYPMSETLFSGRLAFDYGDWSFNRLMAIGVR